MLQLRSWMDVADNTGARRAMFISKKGQNTTTAGVGDVITVHIKESSTDASVKTLPIGLAEFSTEYDTDWGAVMAASVIMTLPIAIMFFGLQKLFVGGLISGGVKG